MSKRKGPQSSRQAELHYTYMYRVRYLELQAPAADESATRGVSPPGAPPTSPSTVTSAPSHIRNRDRADKESQNLTYEVRRRCRHEQRRRDAALAERDRLLAETSTSA